MKQETQELLGRTLAQMEASVDCLMSAGKAVHQKDWRAARHLLASIPRDWSSRLDPIQLEVNELVEKPRSPE